MKIRRYWRKKESNFSPSTITYGYLQARPFGSTDSLLSAYEAGSKTYSKFNLASLPIQPKLANGPLGDRYEQSEELRMKVGLTSGQASEEFESILNQSRNGGVSLDTPIRSQMESAMGADFSQVKVHTDSQADQLNRSIQAKAFTTGNDVFFQQGAYNPANRQGQALIAHELTHVVQQTGRKVQKKETSISEVSTAGQLTSGPNLPTIQAAFEAARIVDTAHLHKLKDGNPAQVKEGSKGCIGRKLKLGDWIEADVLEEKEGGAWVKAKDGTNEGYIRRTKVYLPSSFGQTIQAPDYSSDKLEQAGEVTDSLGSGHDTLSGGLENISGTEKGKAGLDVVSGTGDTVTGILGMIGSAKEISTQKTRWENMELGYGFVESVSKSTSGSTKIVDSFSKALGDEKGVGESDTVGKYTSAVSDGLSAVKSSALGVIGLYRLYKSQSSEKPKDAAVAFKQLTEAALGAAKVAKSAYDIIGNGIPMSVVYTIPALSIAISAINLLIRLADAIKAGAQKVGMGDTSETLRASVASLFKEPVPDHSSDSRLFDKDRRGTFPAYKTYFRVKQPVRAMVKDMLTAGEQGQAQADQTHSDPAKLEADLVTAVDAAYDNICLAADNTRAVDGTLKQNIKEKVHATPTTRKGRLRNLKVNVRTLNYADRKINEYEFADKMSEINQKRQTSGWTDVALELVNMSGDITTIATGATGVGAMVGQAIKASSGGYKLAHGGAKFAQKLYRDRDQGDDKKSTTNKHREYVNHARFIFKSIASVKSPQDTRIQLLDNYIKATGVNTGMFYALSRSPDKQIEMMVAAMKQRS
ncbi:DUF4157 domain-containing protein [Romeria aff. gracilis LEGE 07310]|uniref:DUF4157 domain-containing protein n=1 Tax=Vasconcelosia minhoensis LEGE 07310 TaxID=915328 RepID=A0A8J7AGL0_9CYAN|nr:DUF4157 domain-containing protein [Romeria gracilis]MBE9078776.1 DUF4157 domain-containing protein [Romeria aff. gracilis LEGE 07310]